MEAHFSILLGFISIFVPGGSTPCDVDVNMSLLVKAPSGVQRSIGQTIQVCCNYGHLDIYWEYKLLWCKMSPLGGCQIHQTDKMNFQNVPYKYFIVTISDLDKSTDGTYQCGIYFYTYRWTRTSATAKINISIKETIPDTSDPETTPETRDPETIPKTIPTIKEEANDRTWVYAVVGVSLVIICLAVVIFIVKYRKGSVEQHTTESGFYVIRKTNQSREKKQDPTGPAVPTPPAGAEDKASTTLGSSAGSLFLVHPHLQTCEYASVQKKAYENVSDVPARVTSSSDDRVKPKHTTKEDYENIVQAQELDEDEQLSDDGSEGDNSDDTSGVESDNLSLNYTTIVFHK
ncbi:uncharacterized protein LOC143104386 [Alosa pseudoharengus]|uniref:uncharacterized protein LOC143104386 n=1 Tax=Alosa pseudoharengus TaxID=34774 RepID=UPI003F8A9113